MSRFVFFETPRAVPPALAACRADLAALQMQWALIKLAWKYSPDQPRVPAGNPDGGQWTSSGTGSIAANNSEPLVPNGVYGLPVTYNPLDPRQLNPATMSLKEQQQVADAVNRVNSGMTAGMRGHLYQNRPDMTTGAMLPPSVAGYKTYDIGPKSGPQRLLVENVTRQMYYTNNHYKSFWLIIPDTKSAIFRRNTKVAYAKN